MLKELKAYRCTRCKKLYVEHKPESCPCEATYKSGKIVGPFQLQERLPDRDWRVICMLCGLETNINATNMKRQKSCGCKPRHAEVLSMSEDEVRYRCRKCGTSYTQETPVLFWCCSEEEE